jgi:type II secretory pathway component PulK
METTAVIAVAIAVVILTVILSNYINRLKFEKRFQEWRDEEIQKWQAEMEEARKTAVVQSRAVLGGKFTEQIVRPHRGTVHRQSHRFDCVSRAG